MKLITFYTGPVARATEEKFQVLNESAYAGVAIPLLGSYDTAPVPPYDSFAPQAAMLRRVLTIDPWPWVVLNRFIGARPDGGETTPGYCNRSVEALRQKIADRDGDVAGYLEQFPDHLFLGGTISPFHDYAIATGFIETGYKDSDFETIEDFEPMFKTLFDAYDYVWIYASSAAKTLPYRPANSQRYSRVLRKALDASAAN